MISSVSAHYQAARPLRPRAAAPAQDRLTPVRQVDQPTKVAGGLRQHHAGPNAPFIAQVLGQQTPAASEAPSNAARNYPSQQSQEIFGPAEEIIPMGLMYLDLTV